MGAGRSWSGERDGVCEHGEDTLNRRCGQASDNGDSRGLLAGTVWVMAGLLLALGTSRAAEEPPMALVVTDNMNVGMNYTLTVDEGVVDSTEGKEPFHYVHGQGQIIPGLEQRLEGMHVGETKEVTIPPDDGYGSVDPMAFVEVAREQFSIEGPPAVGMVVRGVSQDGQEFQATVHELKGDEVVLDLNHPLAGKTLIFQVTVTDISPVSAP